MKIYDCFNFFNELDILEIRLNTLHDVVDYFIIVEADVKHSGEPKPFYLDDNMERFSKFQDKIISYKIFDTPNNFMNLPPTEDEKLQEVYHYIQTQTRRFNRQTQPDYGRDFFQKESVRRAVHASGCDDEDIIIISDADEIPNPELLKNLETLDLENNIYSLNQYMYCYYINVLKQTDWYGSKMGKYKNVKKYSFNEIRGDESLTTKILNGGWHFSFMGGKEMVKSKITSYSAREMANPQVLAHLESNMANNVDPFFRGSMQTVELDNTYPKYLLENLDKYNHMVKL